MDCDIFSLVVFVFGVMKMMQGVTLETICRCLGCGGRDGFRSLRSAESGLARLPVGGQRATARAVASKWSRRLYNTPHLTHHNMSSGYGLTGGMCDHSGQA
jgi:hypothetical protein